ncbi:serine/threonine protein kinase [Corallococcus sp. H22C18031201]|uniref:serine/threonine-protein kinase n=1 Tax=Citreicoccus inhibens TaxID=2849499 RepID=UPI000E76DE99|nr:serine/threonine-protein kinase [Citreicoccus inhibens]MBU8895402.1 serine/threonine protein kinase [Citreicoccus inhibens]RJS22561.1 serine/threonine protein kinase [Corallococcus sp. H22C18031201]
MPVAEKPVRHRKIGAYRILGELGRGGMALVYRGLHEMIQREVAIKELLPEGQHDKEAVSRFRRESLALAAFRHQNIVTLYDLVEKGESLFMVMEYVDGPTLHTLIKEGPLPPDVAAVVGARIASALDHAHFRRIIHRDLKPANVMLTKAGEVKLMDFGIAKDVGLEALTQQGMAVGTPSYMSPEQVTGAPLDARTDIFSLGVLLYEALTGARPFQGKTAGEVFARIRDGKYPPLHKVAPSVPAPLARIVRRALEVKPEDRFPDAAAMRRELDVFLAHEVQVSHAALLVAFLRFRQKLTETEALAHLTQKELGVMEAFDAPRPRASGGRLKWVLAAAAAVVTAAGTGLYFTQAQWAPLVQHLTR